MILASVKEALSRTLKTSERERGVVCLSPAPRRHRKGARKLSLSQSQGHDEYRSESDSDTVKSYNKKRRLADRIEREYQLSQDSQLSQLSQDSSYGDDEEEGKGRGGEGQGPKTPDKEQAVDGVEVGNGCKRKI